MKTAQLLISALVGFGQQTFGESTLEETTGTSELVPDELEDVSKHLRSSNIFDSLPDLWSKGQSVVDDMKCAQLPSTSDCCKNNCPICVGGKVLEMLNSSGKFADVFSATKVNQAQVKAGEICGMPETYCKQLTKYFDSFPSWLTKMLSYVMTVPHYYKAGECPNSALSQVLVSTGGVAGAVLMTYLI